MYVAHPTTVSEWETLVHFHTVLGKLLELRGDKPGSSNNPRTPLGQWELAVKAEEQLRKQKGDSFVGSIELYQHLAFCYQRNEQPQQAIEAWLTSAERAVAITDVVYASRILRVVSENELSDPQRGRRDELMSRIKVLQEPQIP